MRKLKRQEGFTLIEILIAMSIISLIAMAFFTFINSSIKFNTKNDQDIKALNIAQSEIENLRQQIKVSNSNSDLKIELDDGKIINIPQNGDENICWNQSKIQKINISSSGIYKDYIGENLEGARDNSIIKYTKNIGNIIYTINLDISRELIGIKFLYKINVHVNTEQGIFSKKVTNLVTQILSK